MNYFYQYDLTALILLIILIWLYFMKKNYPTKTNKIYLGMVSCCFISSAFDVMSIFIGRNPENFPIGLIYLINMIYLMAYNGTGIVFYVYVLMLIKNDRIQLKYKIVYILVTVIDAFVIFSSPVTKFAFSVNKNGEYSRGDLMIVLYITALFLLVSVIINFIKYNSRLTRIQMFSIRFFVVLTIASTLIQLFFPEQLVSNLICALFLVLVYLTFQNPDDYINNITHCFNETGFYATVDKNIFYGKPFVAVAFMPDDYTYIRQVLGDETTDNILNSISSFLLKKYENKMVYYIFDGCFAIVSDEENMGYDVIYSDIKEYFDEPLKVDGMKITISPLVCIVKYPDFIKSVADLKDAIKYAFKEMRKTRDNDVLMVSADSLEARRRSSKIIQIIKKAMLEDGFDVYYQPIYDTEKKKFISAEALIRLKSDEIGYISPEEFIPLAEKNGMIIQIGENVFRKVCSFLKESPATELGIEYIEVNLSVVQCMQNNLAEKLIEIMDEYDISYNRINFEITETARSINDEFLKRNMMVLMEKGSTFSMDDFGTGYSNTNNLVSLPMEIIKIDKSILWSAMDDEEAFVILWHTVQMIKDLKKKVVVEGVETEKMQNILTEMGCDYLQGYLFSKPVPGDRFIEFLRKYKHIEI